MSQIDWKYPICGEMPPSDPYKQYLVVYTPHGYCYGENGYDTAHTRFEISSYYPGELYKGTPWHFDICTSVKTKEIIAWADVGDAKSFNKLFSKIENLETILDPSKIQEALNERAQAKMRMVQD